MNKQTALMAHDGRIETVEGYRTTGSIEADSLAWRFLTPRGTIVVRPVQIPSCHRPVCVPAEILSAMGDNAGDVSTLIMLAHGRATEKGEPQEPNYPAIDAAARKKADHSARDEWYSKRSDLQKKAKTIDPGPWGDAFNRKLAEEAARFWPDVFAEADAAKKRELAEKYIASIPRDQYRDRLRIYVRDELFAQRDKQHAGLRKRVREETEQEDLAAEKAITKTRAAYERERHQYFRQLFLYELNEFIGWATGKKPVNLPRKGPKGYSPDTLKEIVRRLTDKTKTGPTNLERVHAFILHDLFRAGGADTLAQLKKMGALKNESTTTPPPGSHRSERIQDRDTRSLVRFMEGVFKCEGVITWALLKAYNHAMPAMFKGWTKEVCQTHGMKTKDAERFLIERITFIAECDMGRFRYCYPVEAISVEQDVSDHGDRAPYEIPVREDGATRPPVGVQAKYVPDQAPRKKKGRPKATREEQEHDKRIHDGWESFKNAAPDRARLEDYALERDLPVPEARRAINSHKKRLRDRITVKAR